MYIYIYIYIYTYIYIYIYKFNIRLQNFAKAQLNRQPHFGTMLQNYKTTRLKIRVIVKAIVSYWLKM